MFFIITNNNITLPAPRHPDHPEHHHDNPATFHTNSTRTGGLELGWTRSDDPLEEEEPEESSKACRGDTAPEERY